MPKIVLKSSRIITPDGLRKGYLTIQDGRVEDISEQEPKGNVNIEDLGDHVVMAGIIDPHVHINEPGRTEWEGFDTGTRAALAGGVTTLIEMPLNASPVTTTVEAFKKKIDAANGKLHTHCGFWGGLIPGNEKDIEPLIDMGVFGFKAFLTHSGIDEFPNVTEADLRKVMPILAKHKLPLLVHCELSNSSAPHPASSRSYNEYLLSRPRQWEDDAIRMMIHLCEEFDCRTHIVHLSSSDSIEAIVHAKEKGLPLTVETCQHYLYFNAEDIPDGRTEFKCAPPIREMDNNKELWQALKGGVIDFVATDHSPAPPAMKEISSGDLMKAWGGISSIQFALPVLWTAAKKNECTLSDIARWLSERPSMLPGLQHNKGKLEKGFDADIVVWDPEASFVLTTDMIYHRHKITPYLGEKLLGVTKQIWLAGKKAFENNHMAIQNQGHLLLYKH